jgi:hypothetical protein
VTQIKRATSKPRAAEKASALAAPAEEVESDGS